MTPFQQRMKESAERKARIRKLRKKKRADGSRRYTDRQIADLVGVTAQYVGQVGNAP